MSLSVLLPAYAAQKKELVTDSRWTKKYDKLFRKYSKRYFGPGFDWRWFKAQGIAESRLKPSAKSHVGALGVMQIMPATYKEIKQAKPYLKSIHTPKWNIAAGIYYDRQLYNRWKKVKNGHDRLLFTMASYNAGFGRVHKSYRKLTKHTDEQPDWLKIKGHLPGETRGYVHRIRGLMGY